MWLPCDVTRAETGAEVDEPSDSGLLGITVPRSHGGAEVSARTLGEIVRLLSAAASSIGRFPRKFDWRGRLRQWPPLGGSQPVPSG